MKQQLKEWLEVLNANSVIKSTTRYRLLAEMKEAYLSLDKPVAYSTQNAHIHFYGEIPLCCDFYKAPPAGGTRLWVNIKDEMPKDENFVFIFIKPELKKDQAIYLAWWDEFIGLFDCRDLGAEECFNSDDVICWQYCVWPKPPSSKNKEIKC